MVQGFMQLNTTQLTANYITISDKALYCQIYTDPKLMLYVGSPLKSEVAEKAWLTTLTQTQSQISTMRYWVISQKSNRTKIGLGGLIWEKGEPRKASIGCMFLTKAHGKGLATEFLAELGKHAFNHLELTHLYSDSMIENKISYNLMCRLGYSYKNINLARSPSGKGYYWELSRSQWLKNNKTT